eukprot:CAMPEP_0182438628 /NCGR_PEP_ID=MMETSP1167-20130531/85904_1 /TAXON_ID=2988 /ORGANISM="Mallomonas Sp, Strain CCMP3275" /LENGTH=581 /DNA_ID=CAMNT_0024632077 /DNA_START=607 /DNA_END=2349 /DNA_ORIENTATION=-
MACDTYCPDPTFPRAASLYNCDPRTDLPPLIHHIQVTKHWNRLDEMIENETRLPIPYVKELVEFGAVYYSQGTDLLAPTATSTTTPVCTHQTLDQSNTLSPRQLPLSSLPMQSRLKLSRLTSLVSLSLPVPSGSYCRIHVNPKRYPAAPRMDWSSLLLLSSSSLVVLDKPAGVPVSPSTDNLRENVQFQVSELMEREMWVTGRLDVCTSGVVVLGTREGAREVNKCLRERRVQKTYIVLCEHKQEPNPLLSSLSSSLSSPLSKDGLVIQKSKGERERERKREEGPPLGSWTHWLRPPDSSPSPSLSLSLSPPLSVSLSSSASLSNSTHSNTDNTYTTSDINNSCGERRDEMNRKRKREVASKSEIEKEIKSEREREGWRECVLRVLSARKVTEEEMKRIERTVFEREREEEGERERGRERESDIFECEVELLTGRTHQIRRQFAMMGYPIVGDTRYGGERERERERERNEKKSGERSEDPMRIGLHCHRLVLPAKIRENESDRSHKEKGREREREREKGDSRSIGKQKRKKERKKERQQKNQRYREKNEEREREEERNEKDETDERWPYVPVTVRSDPPWW